MTEPETKAALEDESKVGPVLIATTEVFRRRYGALLPKALAFLDHPNEVFRANTLTGLFNFMPERAFSEIDRALRMLESDPSSMVRGAAAGALSHLGTPKVRDRIEPALRGTILRAIADAIREEPDDRARTFIFDAFARFSGQKHELAPLDLAVDQVDWAFVEEALRLAKG
jgi:hypothetical protein